MHDVHQPDTRTRIAGAWCGRISGCQLGKPVELLSMRHGRRALLDYLADVDVDEVRDYIPWDGTDAVFAPSCRDWISRSEPDDDINYSVLALMMLERHGADLTTADVARAWLRHLPYGSVYTAERAAYATLAARSSEWFAEGADPGFDLAECSDNRFNDWIGAQIRTDVYGWVCPGEPECAAALAAADAELSHRGVGVDGAVFVAACGAAIPVSDSLDEAIDRAVEMLPGDSAAVDAINVARSLVGRDDAVDVLHAEFAALSPVHTLNNLAVVVWALSSHPDDFGAAIGDAVAAGWDTDCNGATVGGLWGLTGRAIPPSWTEPWHGRVGVSLAGISELALGDLVDRTVAVSEALAGAAD
jgi:ADP-ribosylglycohydrolase